MSKNSKKYYIIIKKIKLTDNFDESNEHSFKNVAVLEKLGIGVIQLKHKIRHFS